MRSWKGENTLLLVHHQDRPADLQRSAALNHRAPDECQSHIPISRQSFLREVSVQRHNEVTIAHWNQSLLLPDRQLIQRPRHEKPAFFPDTQSYIIRAERQVIPSGLFPISAVSQKTLYDMLKAPFKVTLLVLLYEQAPPHDRIVVSVRVICTNT